MRSCVRVLPLVLVAALSACGDGKPVAPQPTESAAVAPEAKPGLALTGGRLVLPAVKGNPGAVYFVLRNGSDKPVTLAAVDVAGAGMAMLHETTQADGHSTMAELKDPAIAPGAILELAPGGKHVMLDGVPADWKPGGTAELTLVFADGDKLSAQLKVEAPGGD
ncbi:copper chaperone PCu(A)C [Novosphingobium flavum]|uniref:copper chaperone PCu(A)C n=1 Tax=Novosphingobium aerophilum TaxID=2839843 RepID=UPI00163AD6FC|nr:copper chaperone PCu(A)C [Novosphingobium aerophilum]MBC2660457.1 copper chaperone PCu(A)C [Novosphingobium aerophilum]